MTKLNNGITNKITINRVGFTNILMKAALKNNKNISQHETSHTEENTVSCVCYTSISCNNALKNKHHENN